MKALLAPVALASLPLAALQAADIKSPEETYKGFPNRLADLPPGWSTTRQIRGQVCFNPRYQVNSPEADAFLKYYREQWKPAVTEASEQLTILDSGASAP